jgi:DNA-binding NarL/FixJ family response regulator
VTLRLLVADDDPDYRSLVALALATDAELDVAAEAATAAELVERAAAIVPDVVLLDASLPGGVAAVAAVREVAPAARVVLTSSLPAARVAHMVEAAGAVGSLAKDVPVGHVSGAIRQLGALVSAAERSLRTARRALPRTLESVPASRRMARAALDGWCDDDVRSTVELLITELASNGIRHADSDLDVRIAVGARSVRVEVADHDATAPVIVSAGPTDLGGRGMRIVDEMATRWGVEHRRTGKSVWFELPRTGS